MVLLDAALHLVMNYPIGAVTPTAPSAARHAQIMVLTRGGPCRAFMGQGTANIRAIGRGVDIAPESLCGPKLPRKAAMGMAGSVT
jgi:hypothetical protein